MFMYSSCIQPYDLQWSVAKLPHTNGSLWGKNNWSLHIPPYPLHAMHWEMKAETALIGWRIRLKLEMLLYVRKNGPVFALKRTFSIASLTNEWLVFPKGEWVVLSHKHTYIWGEAYGWRRRGSLYAHADLESEMGRQSFQGQNQSEVTWFAMPAVSFTFFWDGGDFWGGDLYLWGWQMTALSLKTV